LAKMPSCATSGTDRKTQADRPLAHAQPSDTVPGRHRHSDCVGEWACYLL